MNHPLRSVDPRTVIEDIGDLDGCWANVLAWPFGRFFVVYEFDGSTASFVRWSFLGEGWLAQAAIKSLPPIVTAEVGTFEVLDENHVMLRVDRILGNVALEDGTVSETLIESINYADEPLQRPSLVTRSGDALLWYIDVDSAESVDPNDVRYIFFRFGCPTDDATLGN